MSTCLILSRFPLCHMRDSHQEHLQSLLLRCLQLLLCALRAEEFEDQMNTSEFEHFLKQLLRGGGSADLLKEANTLICWHAKLLRQEASKVHQNLKASLQVLQAECCTVRRCAVLTHVSLSADDTAHLLFHIYYNSFLREGFFFSCTAMINNIWLHRRRT